MKKICFLILCFSKVSFAFDINEYINLAKQKMNELIGNQSSEILSHDIKLPEIPKVIKNATSLSVYEKDGEIFKQGEKYKMLSLKEKRKYRLAFVEELYFVVNEVRASNRQLGSSLNILEKGGSREGVYRSLVLSADYANLESYRETPKEELVKFSINLASKFLNMSIKEDALKKLNLYSIKKILTEKLLEVMDSFPSNGKDLKSWYSVLSSDFASEFSKSFKGKLRTSLDRGVHFKWASTVPLQHIKSEVIIKVHKVMNLLQK